MLLVLVLRAGAGAAPRGRGRLAKDVDTRYATSWGASQWDTNDNNGFGNDHDSIL